MPTYKLINTKPNETPDEAIIRCANNLVKAVLASGRSLHCTSGYSGVDVCFYDHRPNQINIYNTIANWRVTGCSPLNITFKVSEPKNDLTQDDAV